MPERPTLSVSLRLFLCIALIVGVGLLTVLTFVFMQRRIVTQTEVKFTDVTDAYTSQLTQRIESYGDLLYATRGLFAATTVDAKSWDRFIDAQHTFERYAGIKVIGYAEAISEQQKPAYITRIQRELGTSAFHIYPDQPLSEHAPLTYLSEDDRTPPQYGSVFGFDLMSDENRRITLERARTSGAVSGTAPLQLVGSNKPGFLLVLPISGISGRQGYSVAALEIGSMIDKILGVYLSRYDSNLSLDDVTEGQPLTLYDKSDALRGPTIKRTVSLQVSDRKWQATFEAPTKKFQTVTDRMAAIAILGGGLVLTLGIAVVFYSLKVRHKLMCIITP